MQRCSVHARPLGSYGDDLLFLGRNPKENPVEYFDDGKLNDDVEKMKFTKDYLRRPP